MSFWLGHINPWDDLSGLPDLCRMPFTTCWFEYFLTYNSIDEVFGILVSEDQNKGKTLLKITLYGRLKGQWHFFSRFDVKDHFGDVMTAKAVDGISLEDAEWITSLVMKFLTAINCTNVRSERHEANARLQKKRAKKGKKPLFSYWTLQLEPTNGGRNDLGGTHASPRVHLRRGHPRRLASGKTVWVQPHVVGHGPGIVHKDYDGAALSLQRSAR